MKTEHKKHSIFILLFLILVTFAVYFNSLKGEFVYDDKVMISTYELVKHINNIPKAFISPTSLYGNTNYYRPIQTVSYILDYFLWGNDPIGFHISNIIFHILAVMSIYFFIDVLFNNRAYAVLTTLFFSVHPVHSSVVSYIAGRADSILCVFMFLCLFFYIKFKYIIAKKYYLILSICFFILSLLTKELALIIPIVIILFNEFLYKWTILKKNKAISQYYYPYAVIAALYIFFRLKYMSFYVPGAIRPFPFYNRIITVPYVLLQYLRLLILPNDLHLERLPWVGSSFIEDKIFISSIFLVLLISAVYLNRKKFKPLFFGFVLFLVLIFPSLNIITPLFSTIAESWLYIPSVGLFLVLSFFVVQIYNITKRNKFLSYGFILIVILYMYSMAFITILHNRDWKDGIALCKNTIKFNPLAFKMHNNLGVEYLKNGEFDKAEASFRKCLEIKPDTGMAYFNLYRIYKAKGDIKEANRCLNKAKQLDPGRVNILIQKMGIK